MTTGNTAAITVSAAAMAQAPVEDDCKELERNNETRRDHVESNTKDKRLRNKSGLEDQEGTTISSCKFQAPSTQTARCASAHSHGRAHEMFPSKFVGGGSDAVRSGSEGVMCSEKIHRPPYKQKSGHAEARILDTYQRTQHKRDPIVEFPGGLNSNGTLSKPKGRGHPRPFWLAQAEEGSPSCR